MKIGKGDDAVEFTSEISTNIDPYIIGVFADEHSGKTRLPLTGPSGIGCVITEMKSYVTLDKDSKELGKRIFKPKDPMALIVSSRKVSAMKNDVERQMFYQEHCKRFEDTTFGLLEHKDVNLVMIDKFTHYCVWKEFAINGIGENFVKIDGKLVQRKKEVIQAIIDFMNSLSQFGKPVVLTCASKPDYDVVDKEKKPLRDIWDCGSFYFLGSHTNLTVELQNNKQFDEEKKGKGWKYRLNVRTCQKNPNLQGPDGQGLLEDDAIGLPQLIQAVDPDCDLEAWM